jgi:glycosyltransferase involved in cell wall biosynthesis
MFSKPIISIIVPLHNQAQYVAETIESVLAQTFSDWELIIVNDASTDGGDRIVAGYQDQRIKLLHLLTPSGGPGKPRNTGLDQAIGEWVIFLDSDDSIEPDHLETLLKDVEEHPQAAVIAGHWQEYPDGNPDLRTLMEPAGYQHNALSDLPYVSIAYAPWEIHAAMVKREILSHPYRWAEELDRYLSEDTAFWFRILTKYPCAYSAGRGALYRKRSNSRNQYDHPEKWFTGLKAVTDSNVSFMKQQQLSLTAKHCESLMRLYSSIYFLAKRHHNQEIVAASLAVALDWMDKCSALRGCTSLSLKVRKVFGLQRFLSVMYLKQSVIEIINRFSKQVLFFSQG